MKQIEVHSSKQMKEELDKSLVLLKNSELKPFVFMAAAVSDYIPHATSGKLKKTNIGEAWSLELKQNVDILASLDKENVFSIGFKAEMDEKSALGNAEAMLKKKDLDAVCLNLLKDDKSFGTQDNAIEFLTKTGQVSLPSQDKLSLSLALLELCKSL